jgi:hypothetical protein
METNKNLAANENNSGGNAGYKDFGRTQEIIKSNERLYSFNFEGACGIILPEKIMKKIAKHLAKYTDEVKKILYENKDDLHEYNWTLANKMNGDKIEVQRTIVYITKNRGNIDHRLSLFHAPKPKYLSEVFIVKDYKEAEQIAELVLAEELAQNSL